MLIKAVVFDMDDTLFMEEDYIHSGFKVIDKWVKNHFGTPGFYNLAFCFFANGERELIFNKVLSKMNLNFDDEVIQHMVNIYRSHVPEISLLNDASWILDKLYKKVKLGLISDGFYNSQIQKVKALNLNTRFDSIILSDKYGRDRWKPSSVPFEEARMELKCEHHECVYVGDNIKKDFIMAKKLGWTTIQVIRNHGIYSNIKMEPAYQAHYQISNLTELKYLKELKNFFITYNNEVIK